MKTRRTILFVAVLSLYASGIVFAADDPEPKQISNTRIANVMVKISCDSEILPLSPYMVENLVLSYRVAGKPAQEILKISPDDIYDLLSVNTLEGHTIARKTALRRARMRRTRAEDDEALVEERRLLAADRSKMIQARKKEKEQFEDERAMMEMMKVVPKFERRRYDRAPEAHPSSEVEHTLLMRLQLILGETDATPAAEEFMGVVVQNLRRALQRTYGTYESQLRDALSHAYQAREDAERDINPVTEADIAVKQQLEEVVELSDLNPGMAFGDALDMLRHSVTPPLRIIVIWGDLLDYDLDQTIAINMDPIPSAPVGTALELLLNSVSAGVAEMKYVVKDGVIVIATAASLPAPQQMLLHRAKTSLPVEVLLERKRELIHEIQSTQFNIARGNAHRLAFEKLIVEAQHQMAENLKDDPITKELENLIKQHEVHLENLRSLQKKEKVATMDLTAAEQKLTEVRIQLAHRRDEVSQKAGTPQIAKYREGLAEAAVDVSVWKAEMEVRQKQLAETENQLKAVSAVSPNALRMQLATEALEQAEHRVNELKIRIAALTEPTVIVIGAD